MSQALNEFVARLGELSNDVSFLAQAFELRPRINQVLDFERRGETLEMARRFGEIAGSQPASFCGPMLVRLVASFERYLRSLLQETVEMWATRAKEFDHLPEGLAERNLVLSGRFIGTSDAPRDYMTVDMFALVDNLATCRKGTARFKLNSQVFMDQIYGVTPEVIEKGLKTVRVTNWMNIVGADKPLQTMLGVSRVPDATKALTVRLKQVSRWRNNWAHGGDEEISLTFAELNDELDFLLKFTSALDSAVTKLVNKAQLP